MTSSLLFRGGSKLQPAQLQLLRPRRGAHPHPQRLLHAHAHAHLTGQRTKNRTLFLGASSFSSSSSSSNANTNIFQSESVHLKLSLALAAAVSLNCAYHSYNYTCTSDSDSLDSDSDSEDSLDSISSPWRNFQSILGENNISSRLESSITSCEAAATANTESTTRTTSNNHNNQNHDDDDDDDDDDTPEEDEPTSCTICLINRQGPCRPHWRKFEKCMKDHSSKQDNDNGNDNGKDNDNETNNDNDTPSMSSKCDQYMLPWITCVQQYRNKYTVISNEFFQKEMIDPIESIIEDCDRVLLDTSSDRVDIASIVQVGEAWRRYKDADADDADDGNAGDAGNADDGKEVHMDGNKTEADPSIKQKEEEGLEEDEQDISLVEGVARINL